MKFKQLVLLVIALPMLANASKEVGNGGVVMSCPQQTAVTYDLYEGEILRKLTPIWQNNSHGPLALAKEIAHRMSTINPILEAKLQSYLDSFLSEAQFENINLVRVPDDAAIALCPEGQLTQAVVQRAPMFVGDVRYYVSQNIWDEMSQLDQAALLLHEVIYRVAIEGGRDVALASRYLNSLLWADKLGTLSQYELLNLFAVHFGQKQVLYYNNSTILIRCLDQDTEYPLGTYCYRLSSYAYVNAIVFEPGKPTAPIPIGNLSITPYPGTDLVFETGTRGRISSIWPAFDITTQVPAGNIFIHGGNSSAYRIEYHPGPGYHIRGFWPQKEMSLKSADGRTTKCTTVGRILLTIDGYLELCNKPY